MTTDEQNTIDKAARNIGALKTPQIKTFRKVIKANDRAQIDSLGNFFYVKEATDPILYQMDNDRELPFDVGTGINSRGFGMFERLTLINPWSHDVTIEVYIGLGEIIDNRFTLVPSHTFTLPVSDAPSVAIGQVAIPGVFVGGVLAAGEHVDFPGVFPLPLTTRKALYVSNKHPNDYITLYDEAGTPILAIEPKSSSQYPLTGFVRVSNDGGNPIACAISEIVYKRPV